MTATLSPRQGPSPSEVALAPAEASSLRWDSAARAASTAMIHTRLSRRPLLLMMLLNSLLKVTGLKWFL